MGFCLFPGENFFLGSSWPLSLPVCPRSLGHYRDRTRDVRGTLRLSFGAISHLLHTCTAKETAVPCPFPFQPSVFPMSTRWHTWGRILSICEQAGLRKFRRYKLVLAHVWPLWTYSHFSWFLKSVCVAVITVSHNLERWKHCFVLVFFGVVFFKKNIFIVWVWVFGQHVCEPRVCSAYRNQKGALDPLNFYL